MMCEYMMCDDQICDDETMIMRDDELTRYDEMVVMM